MRLYLSSYRMGDHPEHLVALAGEAGRRAVVIANAMDPAPAGVRRDAVEYEPAELAGLGCATGRPWSSTGLTPWWCSTRPGARRPYRSAQNKSGITAGGWVTAGGWSVLPRSRYADLSRAGLSRSSLDGPEKRIRPPSMMWAWLARPRATVANCSISSTPVPDSATAAMTGISRPTTTGARPRDSSSMSR